MSALAASLLEYGAALSKAGGARKSALSELETIAEEAAREFPRYQVESRSGMTRTDALRLSTILQLCSSFLTRSGFTASPPTTLHAAEEFANQFRAEVSRTHCTITTLVLLDGFDPPRKEVHFGGGRIFELDKQAISEWFHGQEVVGPLSIGDLEGLAGLETSATAENPPWGGHFIEWEAPTVRLRRFAEPWVTYLNLLGRQKCSTTGMYQRSDSMLHEDQFRAIAVAKPMMETKGDWNEELQEFDEWEAPLRTLDEYHDETLPQFLTFLEHARIAAERLNSHRLETALRYFARVSEAMLANSLALNPEIDRCEDAVIDGVVGLEAIFLQQNERDKMDKIADRSAAVLESDFKAKRVLRKEAKALYKIRSAILHGDARSSRATLSKQADICEQLLRRSIVAFCGAMGDQSRILKAEKDATVADAIRAALPD